MREYRLRAGIASSQIAPDEYPATPVWAYENRVPGPELRVRAGERLRVVLDNGVLTLR